MSNLNYIPIVAEFKEKDNDFGTHGGKIELSDDGIEFIDTTRPYGTVIENSGRFENIIKPNGENSVYVVCDGYVWVDRYPELNVLFEGKPNNQSMEIHVLSGHYGEDNVYYIDDFEYSALCILGKDVTPAFNLAKIEGSYESKDFKVQYEEMMSALEKYLANNITDEAEVEEKIVDDIVENTDDLSSNSNETNVEEVDYKKLYESKLEEYNKLYEDFNNLTSQFEDYKNNYSTPNSEVDELKQFKSTKLADERKEAEDTLFEQFNELNGIEEFENLKKDASKFELETLEKECFAILGKKNAKFSSNKTVKKDKVKIEFTRSENNSDSDCDEFIKKYKNKEEK
jgi:hypothetical protein